MYQLLEICRKKNQISENLGQPGSCLWKQIQLLCFQFASWWFCTRSSFQFSFPPTLSLGNRAEREAVKLMLVLFSLTWSVRMSARTLKNGECTWNCEREAPNTVPLHFPWEALSRCVYWVSDLQTFSALVVFVKSWKEKNPSWRIKGRKMFCKVAISKGLML